MIPIGIFGSVSQFFCSNGGLEKCSGEKLTWGKDVKCSSSLNYKARTHTSDMYGYNTNARIHNIDET